MNQPDSEAMMMIIVMPTMFLSMAWAFRALLVYFRNRQTIQLHYDLQTKVLGVLAMLEFVSQPTRHSG